ncbi:MAG: metallophosphoesterase [Planctomycetes bacterium]|nr:metallophosphoesterase [Planctomycetota bacterium]
MSEYRIVQVSDPHLSRYKAYYQQNWETFLQLMAENPPDLVVCTGDLCVNGVEHDDDLAFARTQLGRLGVPWLAIPGNHDIGDQPPDLKFKKPVDEHKRARWLERFGDDYWHVDRGGWRIIGLDAMLFDSGLAPELTQWAWFERALRECGGRPVLLFVHKPLFLDDPHETKTSSLYYGVDTRQRLVELARHHDIRVIASGHIHRHWETEHAGVKLIWAPSSGFIVTGHPKGVTVGTCEVGFVEYRLSAGSIAHRFNLSPRFVPNDMREVMETLKSTVYLPPRPLVTA